MPKIKAQHILFLIVFTFYLLLSNKDQGFDSYSYALNIRQGVDLFHPHHLIYGYVANLIYRVFGFTGIECLRLISIVNSFLAAITVCLLYLIIKSRQNNTIAIVGSLSIALLYSFWYYATSLEVNIPALLLLVLSFYWLVTKPDVPSKYALGFGFLAAGTLFHQIVIMAFIPLTIYVLIRKVPFKQVILYLIPSIFIVAGAYLLIGYTQIEHKSLAEFYYWLTFYSHLGVWGKLQLGSFVVGGWGIVKTFIGGETIRELVYADKRTTLQYVYLLFAFMFAIVYLLNILSSYRQGLKNLPARTWLILALIFIFAIFAFWWAPTDDGFWLYSILFLTLGVFYLGEKPYRLGSIGLILLMAINILPAIAPASSAKNSIVIQGAEAFNRQGITADDLVITNLIQIRLAYQYYYNVEVPTASLVYSDAQNRTEATRDINNLIKKIRSKGRVFVFENELNPEPHRRFLFERFSPRDYLLIYKPFYPRLIPVDSIPAYGKTVKIYQLVGSDSLLLDSVPNRR